MSESVGGDAVSVQAGLSCAVFSVTPAPVWAFFRQCRTCPEKINRTSYLRTVRQRSNGTRLDNHSHYKCIRKHHCQWERKCGWPDGRKKCKIDLMHCAVHNSDLPVLWRPHCLRNRRRLRRIATTSRRLTRLTNRNRRRLRRIAKNHRRLSRLTNPNCRRSRRRRRRPANLNWRHSRRRLRRRLFRLGVASDGAGELERTERMPTSGPAEHIPDDERRGEGGQRTMCCFADQTG